MPVPRQQMEFLIGALQNNAIDAQQGMDLFTSYQQAQQEKRAARAEMLGGYSSDGLDALRQSAMDLSSGDTALDPESFTQRLMGVGQLYGMDGLPPAIANAIPSLYSSQNVELDEDDRKEIINRVVLQKSQMGRADIRAGIAQEYMSALGPLYSRIKAEVDALIDRAYAGQEVPEF